MVYESSLLLACARISTIFDDVVLTGASGFFFERDGRLFLVTSRHVVHETFCNHEPDSLRIELHVDADNLTQSEELTVPLYDGATPLWRQGVDGGGPVDVAVIELDREQLPPGVLMRAFTPLHLHHVIERVEIGTSLLIAGFPLGFHDTLHHMPVVRQAICASEFGLRFQGMGYFLTDGRAHRGTSGAPVVMRCHQAGLASVDLPWILLGIHSARLDVGSRDLVQDEALGLNCAWYADILMTLTEG